MHFCDMEFILTIFMLLYGCVRRLIVLAAVNCCLPSSGVWLDFKTTAVLIEVPSRLHVSLLALTAAAAVPPTPVLKPIPA